MMTKQDVLDVFGLTEADMAEADRDGYPEAKAQADADRAAFLTELKQRRAAIEAELTEELRR